MPPADNDDYFNESQSLPPLDSMQYWRAYHFIFDRSNWFVNLLLMAVCSLIPIVGSIVLTGYQFEMMEVMHRRGRDDYPEFDFGRFVDYLSRGIWPFLVVLVSMLVTLPFYAAIFGIGFAVTALLGVEIAAFGNWFGGMSPIADVLLVAALFLLGSLASIVYWMMIMSFAFRAGLMQEFGPAFDFQFARQFISLMWPEMVLSWLFLAVTSLAVVLAGFMACFVGVYVAAAVSLMAQAHFQYQLYEVFLSRGGEPIPLKETQ